MMQIPIYRAKKIDSDEWVSGYLIPIQDKHYIIKEYEEYTCLSFSHGETSFEERCEFDLIAPKTIAIHFPNMIDKNGKKIFASLSENGIGGDDVIRRLYAGKRAISAARYKEGEFLYCNKSVEVVGIHQ